MCHCCSRCSLTIFHRLWYFCCYFCAVICHCHRLYGFHFAHRAFTLHILVRSFGWLILDTLLPLSLFHSFAMRIVENGFCTFWSTRYLSRPSFVVIVATTATAAACLSFCFSVTPSAGLILLLPPQMKLANLLLFDISIIIFTRAWEQACKFFASGSNKCARLCAAQGWSRISEAWLVISPRRVVLILCCHRPRVCPPGGVYGLDQTFPHFRLSFPKFCRSEDWQIVNCNETCGDSESLKASKPDMRAVC